MGDNLLKLGIIGTDSSHFELFVKTISNSRDFSSIAIICNIYSENVEQRKYYSRLYPNFNFHNNIELCIHNSDAVLIINRFAESHISSALISVKKRKPMFIDKPIVNSGTEMEALLNINKKYQTPICSFSVYRFSKELKDVREYISDTKVISALFTGPRYCLDLGSDPRFTDIYFYGIHLIEMILDIFGTKISIHSKEASDIKLSANFKYENQTIIKADFLTNSFRELYSIRIKTSKGEIYREISYNPELFFDATKYILSFFQNKSGNIDFEETSKSIIFLDFLRL